jgi:amino acid transporter
VKHRRVNPGRAAMLAVCIAAILFVLAQLGLQGVASYKNLDNPKNSSSPLVYLGNLLTGTGRGGEVLAFALALSVIAATGVGIVLSARIAYGIASHRALPGSLANVSPRFRTPALATIVASLILLVLGWVYLLTTSVQTTFSYVLNNTGILYATFYCVTAIAAVVYYRRRVLSNWRDMLTIGILPIASVGFLAYIAVKSILTAPAAQNYSLLGFAVVGFILILVARFGWKSEFFGIRRESWSPEGD